MRLLHRLDNGDFSLVEYFSDIPRYAFLSHTWLSDSEEVTFKDIMKGRGKNKEGYKKIQFCAEQAARDKLDYFWVDTCCIDKTSSAELSEAINSMFRWYQRSARCYVYMSDVSSQDNYVWVMKAFQESRWFTRGWTLQELIAPYSVEFFSMEGKRLGDKNTLLENIKVATGIPAEVFQGRSPFFYADAERLSWAKNRNTKREEDAAYSLMGLFYVHMMPIYGEGKANAFERLRYETTQNRNSALSSLLWSTWPEEIEDADPDDYTVDRWTSFITRSVLILLGLFLWFPVEDMHVAARVIFMILFSINGAHMELRSRAGDLDTMAIRTSEGAVLLVILRLVPKDFSVSDFRVAMYALGEQAISEFEEFLNLFCFGRTFFAPFT